jgi:hypothetical protein
VATMMHSVNAETTIELLETRASVRNPIRTGWSFWKSLSEHGSRMATWVLDVRSYFLNMISIGSSMLLTVSLNVNGDSIRMLTNRSRQ